MKLVKIMLNIVLTAHEILYYLTNKIGFVSHVAIMFLNESKNSLKFNEKKYTFLTD